MYILHKVRDFGGRQRERRHTLGRSAFPTDCSDEVAVFVIANGGRHGQVRAFSSAGRIRAVTERARLAELSLTASDRFFIGWFDRRGALPGKGRRRRAECQ